MMSRQSDDGSAIGGLLLGFFLLLAIAAAVVVAAILLVVLFRGMVEITRVSVGPMGNLSRRFLGWPSEESSGSLATIITLAGLMWTLVGFVLGLLFWVATGPSLTILLATTIAGLVMGAIAGAAAVAQRPSGEVSENLDDYVSW